MAKSFTLTCPKSVLERVLPDFDVMGGNPSWVAAKTKNTLEAWLLNESASCGDLPACHDKTGEPARLMLSFGGAPESALRGLARKLAISEGEVARRIVYLLSEQGLHEEETEIPVAAEDFVEILRLAGYQEVRHEQISFYLQNKASLNGGKIGLSEAATGTGKTVSMLVAAAEMANARNARVVIAVPTISLIHQFHHAYEHGLGDAPSLKDAIQSRLGIAPELRRIFGRREFVSEFLLRELIVSGELEPQQSSVAGQWLDEAKSGPQVTDSWLVSSLEDKVGRNFPMSDVQLGELATSDDFGFLAYRAQFAHEEAHEAEIVLATHAMLGIDFRARLQAARSDDEYKEVSAALSDTITEFFALSRTAKSADDEPQKAHLKALASTEKDLMRHYESEQGRALVRISEGFGVIPPYRFLMVDECHLFESSLSRVLSNSISLKQIARELAELQASGVKVSKAALKQARAAIDDLVRCSPSVSSESRDGDMVQINSTYALQHFPTLLPAVSAIAQVLDGIPKLPKDADLQSRRLYATLKRDLQVFRSIINGAYSIINFSPVRNFPTIAVGRPSLEATLRQLWAYVEGASCVSATIYLPKGNTQSGWYLKSILAIPDHREAEYAPIGAAWIYRPVKYVWQPSTPDDIAALTPPASGTDGAAQAADTDRWHSAVASVLRQQVIPTAEGGILVLCTSYLTCEMLAQQLSDMPDSINIVAATPKYPLASQKAAFIASRKNNQPTLWLTTGAAWTGLDISGKEIGLPSEEDHLLTDLVIPRLPFNTNRSITHQHRKLHRPSTSWEIFETCFAFRQALGRLIRRMGLPKNRRLWVLDGRLYGKDAGRLAIFQKLLDKYRQQSK